MNNPTEKVVAHVGYQYEADNAVAALSDAGIAAYVHQTPESRLLTFPGAIGMPPMGFDVVVRLADAEKAEEILGGIGFGATEADAENTEDAHPVADDAETAAAAEGNEASVEEGITEGEAGEVSVQVEKSDDEAELPEPTLIQKLLLTFLLLLAVAVVVWLTDTAVDFVKNLLSCS